MRVSLLDWGAVSIATIDGLTKGRWCDMGSDCWLSMICCWGRIILLLDGGICCGAPPMFMVTFYDWLLVLLGRCIGIGI